MKTIIAATALAIVAATGAASAMPAHSQLEAAASRVLTQYGFGGVDASTLSVNQLAGIATAKTDDDSYVDTRTRIGSVLAR